MTTLTLNEAIQIVPAIGAMEPLTNVSKKYQFVSTRDIIEQIQEQGWLLTNVSAQNRSLHAQHRATFVHESSLTNLSEATQDGMMRIELFNSHNRTKRLTFAIGYFRFVCSNGLIIASGPAETIRKKHSFSKDTHDCILDRINELVNKFPTITKKIEDLQARELTEQEQVAYAQYAIKGRYLYRPRLPKQFSNEDTSALKVLEPRRQQDEGNTAWSVFNRVQENLISGISNYSLPIKSYSDSIRVNQLLWKGADATLDYSNTQLRTTLTNFLDKRK